MLKFIFLTVDFYIVTLSMQVIRHFFMTVMTFFQIKNMAHVS